MSEFAGDKTEKPTAKRMEEAIKQGQIARSAEVQTVFVFMAALVALLFAGQGMWRQLSMAMTGLLGGLHHIVIKEEVLQRYAVHGVITFGLCVGPVVVAVVVGGLLAGALQNRFQTSPEALEPNWGRVNPLNGLKRIFSAKALVPAGLAIFRLTIIIALCYSSFKQIVSDPIFYTAVDVARIAGFLAESTGKIMFRIGGIMFVLAAADYGYQWWKTNQDLMMTKEEVKEELKNTEGNPEIKARQRRMRMRQSFRKSLLEVPQADVIVTNPTHFAVALKYDRQTMKAPKIVAKGTRLNALRIREIAQKHGVPMMENKPLARMLFKYGKVGGEIPAELYLAVAEVLAWVYRNHRYWYFSRQNRQTATMVPDQPIRTLAE